MPRLFRFYLIVLFILVGLLIPKNSFAQFDGMDWGFGGDSPFGMGINDQGGVGSNPYGPGLPPLNVDPNQFGIPGSGFGGLPGFQNPFETTQSLLSQMMGPGGVIMNPPINNDLLYSSLAPNLPNNDLLYSSLAPNILAQNPYPNLPQSWQGTCGLNPFMGSMCNLYNGAQNTLQQFNPLSGVNPFSNFSQQGMTGQNPYGQLGQQQGGVGQTPSYCPLGQQQGGVGQIPNQQQRGQNQFTGTGQVGSSGVGNTGTGTQTGGKADENWRDIVSGAQGLIGQQKWAGGNGTDIFVKRGTQVRAPIAGAVRFNMVPGGPTPIGEMIITAPDGRTVRFRHVQPIVSSGNVQLGQPVATVNDTSMDMLRWPGGQYGNPPDGYQHLDLSLASNPNGLNPAGGQGGDVNAVQHILANGGIPNMQVVSRTPGPSEGMNGGMGGIGGMFPGGFPGMPFFPVAGPTGFTPQNMMGGSLMGQMVGMNPLLNSGFSSMLGPGAMLGQGINPCSPMATGTSPFGGSKTPDSSQLAQQIKQDFGVTINQGFDQTQLQAIAQGMYTAAQNGPNFPNLIKNQGMSITPADIQGGAGFSCKTFVMGKQLPPQALTFVIVHELGHVIRECNDQAATQKAQQMNAYAQEGPISAYGETIESGRSRRINFLPGNDSPQQAQGPNPYLGPGERPFEFTPEDRQYGTSCTGSPAVGEDYAEMIAYYSLPNQPENPACSPQTKNQGPPFAGGKYPLHYDIARQVLGGR